MRFLTIALVLFLGFQSICHCSTMSRGVGRSGLVPSRLLVVSLIDNGTQIRLDIPSRRLTRISPMIVVKEGAKKYEVDEVPISEQDAIRMSQMVSSAKKRLIHVKPRSLWLRNSPSEFIGCLTVKWEDRQVYLFDATAHMLELTPKHVRDAYRDVWSIECSLWNLAEQYSSAMKRTVVEQDDPVAKRYIREKKLAYRKSQPRGYVMGGKRYPVPLENRRRK